MAIRKNIIEGLQILEKYDTNGDVDAQHDVLYCTPDGIKVSKEDRARLEELGFFREVGEGWQVFT